MNSRSTAQAASGQSVTVTSWSPWVRVTRDPVARTSTRLSTIAPQIACLYQTGLVPMKLIHNPLTRPISNSLSCLGASDSKLFSLSTGTDAFASSTISFRSAEEGEGPASSR